MHINDIIKSCALACTLCCLTIGAVASAQSPSPGRQQIVFGSDHEYPPFESLDDKGRPVGFNIDLMRAIGEVMGFAVVFELGPWDQVRKKLEVEGTVDVSDMFYSEERAQVLDFADPFTMAYYEIFIRGSTSPINNLEEVGGRRVIVQKDSYIYDYLQNNRLGAQVVPVASEPDALRLLASGEHDCAIVTQIAGRYAIERNKLTNIVSTGPPVLPRQYSLVVVRGRHELLAQLNQGLAIVKSTGRYEEIYDKWFGQLEQSPTTFWDIAKYAVWVVMPLALIAVIAFVWSWSLKKQVTQKTNDLSVELAERQRAEESLRLYAERLKNLHEIDQAILEARSSEEIAQVALRLIRGVVLCRRASVLLFDFETDSATLLAVIAEGETSVKASKQLPLKMLGFNEHLKQGKVEYVDDLVNLAYLSPVQRLLLDEGIHSYIKIPLIAKGELIGSLNLAEDKPAAFSEEHIEIAREIADTLAVAIRQVSLYETEQQARQTAEAMREANLAFTRTLDLDMVLETSLVFLNKIVHYDSANVMLRESETGVEVRASCGYEKWADGDRIRDISFDTRSNPTIHALLKDRKSLLIPDTREYAGWERPAGTEHVLCWLGVPLVAGGEVIGIYSVDKAEPNFFTPEHARLAEALAAQAAVAIQNARLYAQVQEYAETLEERVAERTVELNEHIEEVEHLNLGMGNLLEDLQAVNRHLASVTRRLQDTNEELESFASSVSHDLRAPLRAIQGFANALLEDYSESLDPMGQDYARRVAEAAQRMDALIQDLLDYSRLSRADLHLKPVALKAVIQDALTGLEAEFGRSAAQVSIAEPMPDVIGQHTILVQVVSNLMSNALKFISRGASPQVAVRAEERDGWARLWVEDNGIGISPEHQERIFRVFERLHGIESYPGTGIGLAIVRRGVERMGGRVGLDSSLGRGSRFWIELPRARGKT